MKNSNHMQNKLPKILVGLFCLAFSAMLHAQLTIEITEGATNPTKIAIVPFEQSLPTEITEIITADLQRSGLFEPLGRSDLLPPYPHKEGDIFYRDFRAVGAEYILIGDGVVTPGGLMVRYGVFDVVSQRKIMGQEISGTTSQIRDIAHTISDNVYEVITGIRGAFSTKIIYVQDVISPARNRYRLMLADADGAREKMLFQSSEPLLSPSWSNDGTKVAYVSFETSRPAIFVQNIKTGQREQVTNYKGLNGAPSFSPDDKTLALVLSKDGNPEIYTMNLATKRLRRITKTSPSVIDTEPTWTKDGKSLIFTSNRGGNPQIYKVSLAGGGPERLTFAGDYNARPQVSPDGKTIIMVNRQRGVFHIAWQDLVSGDTRVLTHTKLDESPSIAPNGAMLIYGTQLNGKGLLAAVSMDAGVKYLLPSKKGNVREPAWSPYFE